MGLPGFGTCGKLSFLTNQVSNSKISAVVVSLWWVWNGSQVLLLLTPLLNRGVIEENVIKLSVCSRRCFYPC